MIAFHNNEYRNINDIRISPFDFGFIHSEATYDVIRATGGKLNFGDKHLRRFKENCKFNRFNVDVDFEEVALELLERNNLDDAFVWLCAYKGTPPTGSPRDLSGPTHHFVYVKPYYAISSDPITLVIDEDVTRAPGNQHIKNFCFRELTHAQHLANDMGYDSGIVRNKDGYIAEGMAFGICFIKDNEVYTPATDVLPSVTIEVLEEICMEQGIPFHRVDFRDHTVFDEAIVCSTSGGLTPVSKINNTEYTFDMTMRLRDYYEEKARL